MINLQLLCESLNNTLQSRYTYIHSLPGHGKPNVLHLTFNILSTCVALASELISESWSSVRLIEMLRHVIPFTHVPHVPQ